MVGVCSAVWATAKMSSMVAEPSAFLLTIDESSCCPTFSSAFDDIIVLDLTKIMASVSITSWEIDGETVETVADFIFWGSKITADGNCSLEIKRHSLEVKLWPTHKEIQPVHLKGDQSWVFIGRTDVEAETPILWPPDSFEKTLMLGKIEGGRRRGRQIKYAWIF